MVGTPAIDSGLFGDVYLTFDAVGGLGSTSGNQAINNLPQGSVAIGVVIEPLVAWLWAGGLLIGVGGLLALVPGLAPEGDRSRVGPLGIGDGRAARSAERARAGDGSRAGGRARGPCRRPGMTERRRRHPTRWVAGAVLAVLVVVGHRAGHPHAPGGHRRPEPAARPARRRRSRAPT